MGGAIQILILDGHLASARGLGMVLESADEGLQVLGVASSLAGATKVAKKAPPDVVLADFTTLKEGLPVVERLREAFPDTPVVVLTSSEQADDVHAALRLGASGYLSKRISPDLLVAALRVVASGELFIGPVIVGALLRERSASPVRLSREEIRLLGFLSEGLANSEVASRMTMSESTLKRRVVGVERKLGVRNRSEAVVKAVRLGLI